MTSNDLQEQLTDVENRMQGATLRAADASLSVDQKLEAVQRLDELKNLRRSLERQLTETQQREVAAQKEREVLALETELAELRESYQNNRYEDNEITNSLTQTIVDAVEPLIELNGECARLLNRYESVFRQRHGRDAPRLGSQGLKRHEFSDDVAGLIWQIAEKLAYQKRVEAQKAKGLIG